MRRMLNNFEMHIFRRDVRHIQRYIYIYIEKISIEHTSVGLASARPNYTSDMQGLVWGEPELPEDVFSLLILKLSFAVSPLSALD